ncbi:MAG TPA: type I glutamate--ammonia ligase [Anaerolineaceae bacterium]|nr:type I glutamate--ammonia ligase [Anaerolineaceae bacterium]HOH19670.1 type I glutamate--ammonia ligase [Anaerolineaceae bacterium]HPA32569.1 type I glutamate--ammonia ligase [Anaerolineaceae bacterium]
MFQNFQEAAAYVKENKIRLVDLKFCDLWGRWHHVTISAVEFTPELMESGIGFDGSSVGFKSVKAGDMVLIPDLGTGFMDPFCETPTLSFICNTVEADTKVRFGGDPREVVQRAETFMIQQGLADQSLWGPEFEFYVFNDVVLENDIFTSAYRVDSFEASWNSSQGGDGHLIPIHGGYHAIPPRDQTSDLRSRMTILLEDLGVPVKYHHHEVGGPGQCEIETPLLGILKAADSSLIIKYVTKLVARNDGQTVTFLPKPLFGEAGSGMHFHQQLIKAGKNLFYDPSGPNLLSKEALWYIGGLLTHAPAVLAFTNPSTNSFRRLVPGYEAPISAIFSSGNRSAAIRIPKYATEPDTVRFEFRPPDATCNPYLAMAAQLMAGLDGIRNQIDPTVAGFGPIDDDIFSWPAEKRATIKSLPTSLEEALYSLEKDHAFLLEGGVFTEEMIHNWIRGKRNEAMQVRLRPHPYEVQMYFDL